MKFSGYFVTSEQVKTKENRISENSIFGVRVPRSFSRFDKELKEKLLSKDAIISLNVGLIRQYYSFNLKLEIKTSRMKVSRAS